MPPADLQAHGVGVDALRAAADSPQSRSLVQALCAWARALMLEGAPLALRVPGRAGWELRLVVQGGLRILEKIERMDHATLARRPALTAFDAPLLLWRALAHGRAARMTPQQYVQDKAARSGSSFYYAFLFLPPPRRAAITAFYAFCREVDDVVDEVADPGVAATKLQWWRTEVAQAYAGHAQPPGDAAR